MTEETAFINISVPREFKEKVEEMARAEDRSVSAFFRTAVIERIERLEAEAAKRLAKRKTTEA